MDYLGVVRESVSEKIIEKSRFLTYSGAVDGEEDAKRFLEKIRAAHTLATHVCYAYIADELGNIQRYSDDGEPHGTAGLPILGVIKARNLKKSAVAVVRYFGGIKLGAGGLTRAYTSCAAEGLGAAEIELFSECVDYAVSVSYSDGKTLARFAEGYTVVGREFTDKTVYVLRIRAAETEKFRIAVSNEFCGRAETEERGRGVYPCGTKD